jgi:ribulose 1,5-bisphosphate synthetase/thiazole synthase
MKNLLLAALILASTPAQEIQVTVLGFESATFELPKGEPELVPGLQDAILVGGGMSGLTACWYLKDKQVLVLERSERAGGLAFRGQTEEGIT